MLLSLKHTKIPLTRLKPILARYSTKNLPKKSWSIRQPHPSHFWKQQLKPKPDITSSAGVSKPDITACADVSKPDITLCACFFTSELKAKVRRGVVQRGLVAVNIDDLKMSPSQTLDPQKSPRGTAMSSYVQLLSTTTADTPGFAVMLHTDSRRYIFGNISEGFQRVLVQRKISPRKVEHVFLSGAISNDTTGGLLGLVLTVADISASANLAQEEHREKLVAAGRARKAAAAPQALHIYGGKNLAHVLASARCFVFRRGMPLRPHEVEEVARAPGQSRPDWEDENIKVWHVPVYQSGSGPSRKRSYDEMAASSDSASAKPETTAPQARASPTPMGTTDDMLGQSPHETDQAFRLAVVRNMFESEWSMDALFESPLREITNPAALFVRDAEGRLKSYDGPRPWENKDVPDIKVLLRQPWPASKILTLPPTTPSKQMMCYIVKTQDRRGKFNPMEAGKYGIAPPDFSRLTRGETVVNAEGVAVKPDMVMEPNRPGCGFAVIELAPEYIQDFLERPEWQNEEIMKGIVAMYWKVDSEECLRDTRLHEFIQERQSIKHFLASNTGAYNPLVLDSAAAECMKLNIIDPLRFPLPEFCALVTPSLPWTLGRAGETYQLAPVALFQDDQAFRAFDTTSPLKELQEKSKSGILNLAEMARKKIANSEFQESMHKTQTDIPNLDTEIITLGTGSSLPSKYRNVLATLVRVPGHGTYLLDCGENTLGQLRRSYGFKGADEIIEDLRFVWISHLHADHHLGFVSLMTRWLHLNADNSRKLTIGSFESFFHWMDDYSGAEWLGGPERITRLSASSEQKIQPHLRILKPWTFGDSEELPPGPSIRMEKGDHGISRVQACLVDHCAGALAVAVTLSSGLKFAFSGDCRPSGAFVQIGKDAHLLIHECTFEDDLMKDALEKKHSTMSEVIKIGRRMRARRVLLTHFSQRYPKIPSFDTKNNNQHQADEDLDQSILFAFDYMRVKLGEFKEAAAFLPALRKMYESQEK